MKPRALLATCAALLLSASRTPAESRLEGDALRAARARAAILELDVAAAAEILEGADPADALLAVERARLALYEGACDEAAAVLARSDLAATRAGAEIGDSARGCARATAGTVTIVDDERGVVVRLQDDDDRPLVPVVAAVAARVRDTLAADLGVVLPRPLRIDLVRDQFTLAAMTGLPEEAARTTGTVAIAKWGRVIQLSPRATPSGYPWLDTLAHELTHLALSRGSRDNAPLWLQEGVAKREETRWREAEPFDDLPPADAVAAIGIERGLGRKLDELGPSVAMLPSAEHAAVAFAEVTSFVRFFVREAGDEALPQLLLRLKEASGPAEIDRAIVEVSTEGFARWDERWRRFLESVPRDLPADLAPGASSRHLHDVSRRLRLGQLLAERGHPRAAALELAQAHERLPFEALIRAHLAAAIRASGDGDNAAPLVEKTADVHGRHARWWSLHATLHPGEDAGQAAFSRALALDPFEPAVACEEKAAPELPAEAERAAVCEMARRAPR